jgi:hypothetical protein
LNPRAAGSIALGLGDGGRDGEYQLADAVAGDITAHFDHVEIDAAYL